VTQNCPFPQSASTLQAPQKPPGIVQMRFGAIVQFALLAHEGEHWRVLGSQTGVAPLQL
jgi:hypothetical protein